MWTAEQWEDYELLDCGGGERLERWGQRILIRPDPQAVWDAPRRNPLWDRPDARYFRSRSGGGHWEKSPRWEKNHYPDAWPIRYGDLTFQVKPMNFKHTGLFPEQAANWAFVRRKIQQAGRDGTGYTGTKQTAGGLSGSGRNGTEQTGIGQTMAGRDDGPVRVLNLFAYTGGATVACAKAGAAVCHVDAAKGMVAWGRENGKLSGLSDAPIRWIVDDCGKFVEREIRRGRRYDAIIMDPPSYGRGPGGEVWKLEDSLYGFVKLCAHLLSDRPLFVLINSYTTGLAPAVLGYLLGLLIQPRFGGRCTWDELGLPVTETGLALPCGASGRWEA